MTAAEDETGVESVRISMIIFQTEVHSVH